MNTMCVGSCVVAWCGTTPRFSKQVMFNLVWFGIRNVMVVVDVTKKIKCIKIKKKKIKWNAGRWQTLDEQRVCVKIVFL